MRDPAKGIEGDGDIEPDKTTAAEGETVTLTIVAENGIQLKKLEVLDNETYHPVRPLYINDETNTCTFPMPACSVTYYAVFDTFFDAASRMNTNITITSSWDQIADLNVLLKKLQEEVSKSGAREATTLEKQELIAQILPKIAEAVKAKIKNEDFRNWVPKKHLTMAVPVEKYPEHHNIYYLESKTLMTPIEVTPAADGWKVSRSVPDKETGFGDKEFTRVELSYAIGRNDTSEIYTLRLYPAAQINVWYDIGVSGNYNLIITDEDQLYDPSNHVKTKGTVTAIARKGWVVFPLELKSYNGSADPTDSGGDPIKAKLDGVVITVMDEEGYFVQGRVGPAIDSSNNSVLNSKGKLDDYTAQPLKEIPMWTATTGTPTTYTMNSQVEFDAKSQIYDLTLSKAP
jgi:hypothetical protein